MSARRMAERVMAALILVLLLAAPALGLFELSGLAGDGARERDTAELVLQRGADAIARQDAMTRQLQKLQADRATMSGLLPDPSPGLAAATMQEQVRRILIAAGADVRSAQASSSGSTHGIEWIETQIDFTVPMIGLGDVLQGFAAADPVIVVVDMAVHSGVADGPPGQGSLQVRCTLRGFRAAVPS